MPKPSHRRKRNKMIVREVSVGKEFKFGLPSYSNISARCDMKVELKEGERINWEELWDTINHQLGLQTYSIDPTWMQTREYKNFFTKTIKIPKVNSTPSGGGDGPTGSTGVSV